MNFGILISYVIAGILTISILTVSYNMSYNATEMTTTQIKKVHSRAVNDILTFDIPKIGYQYKSTLSTKFATADSSEITFYANLDNSLDKSVETITWKYTDLPSPDSKNPNDNILKRTVDGDVTNIELGVTKFEIRYYDEHGGSTPMSTPVSSSDFDSIKQIEIEMVLESSYEVNYRAGQENYVQTTWVKRFSPVNLR
ncbi:MAG: hypothetical protein FH748_14490 [Balneolaceae bacterium]|nr:hypothetical protein [Balneolaceae bacterium]